MTKSVQVKAGTTLLLSVTKGDSSTCAPYRLSHTWLTWSVNSDGQLRTETNDREAHLGMRYTDLVTRVAGILIRCELDRFHIDNLVLIQGVNCERVCKELATLSRSFGLPCGDRLPVRGGSW